MISGGISTKMVWTKPKVLGISKGAVTQYPLKYATCERENFGLSYQETALASTNPSNKDRCLILKNNVTIVYVKVNAVNKQMREIVLKF